MRDKTWEEIKEIESMLPPVEENKSFDLLEFNNWLESAEVTYYMSDVQKVRLFYRHDLYKAYLAGKKAR